MSKSLPWLTILLTLSLAMSASALAKTDCSKITDWIGEKGGQFEIQVGPQKWGTMGLHRPEKHPEGTMYEFAYERVEEVVKQKTLPMAFIQATSKGCTLNIIMDMESAAVHLIELNDGGLKLQSGEVFAESTLVRIE